MSGYTSPLGSLYWCFCPTDPFVGHIKTNFLVVGFPEKGVACLEHRFSPQCGWTCFGRVCVLCYYEAIRDPLPSAFTLIGAVRLQLPCPPTQTAAFCVAGLLDRTRQCTCNAAGAAFAAPAHWHATCQLASAACVMVSSSAAYTRGHRHTHVGVGGRGT